MKHHIILIIFFISFLITNKTDCQKYFPSGLYSIEKSDTTEDPIVILKLVNKFNEQGRKLTSREKKTHRLDSVKNYYREYYNDDFRQVSVYVTKYSDSLELIYRMPPDNDCSDSDCDVHRFEINPNINRITKFSYHRDWNGDQEYIDTINPDAFREYTYNNFDLLSKSEAKVYDEELEEVVNTSTNIYSYDTKNNLIEIKFLRRDVELDSLLPFQGFVYHYDVDNKLESAVIYDDPPSGIWYAKDSIHYIYNDQGDVSNLSEYSPSNGNQWWKYFNHEYIYDQGALKHIITQDLNPNGEIQPLALHQDFSYQDSRDIKKIDGCFINQDSIATSGYYYLYSNHDQISTENVIYPIHDFENVNYNQWKNMIIQRESTKYQEDLFPFPNSVSNRKAEYFYSEIDPSSAIELQNNFVLKVYPNPTKDNLYISMSSQQGEFVFSLYDATGILLMTHTVSDGSKVSLKDLSSGVYYYKVINKEGKTASGPVVIAK